jgi:hypothetical protein
MKIKAPNKWQEEKASLRTKQDNIIFSKKYLIKANFKTIYKILARKTI